VIERLQAAAADLGDDAEVKIATQPSYPLQARIEELTPSYADLDDDEQPAEEEPFLWIALGNEADYAPASAWEGGF
jgi:hypothetical protein